MRDIKFRLTKNNKIVGYEKFDGDEWVYSIDGENWYSGNWLVCDTKAQFTGLLDKNGKEIYENDIVRCKNGHIGIVIWEEHDACFNVTGYYDKLNDCPTMAFFEGQPFEILGNIHENPELLEAYK